MATPPLSDEDALAAVAALHECGGNKDQAAKSLDLNPKTFRHRLKRAGERGFTGTRPVIDGFAIRHVKTQLGANGEFKGESILQAKAPGEEFVMAPGQVVDRITTHVNAERRITEEWIKTKAGQVSLEETLERIKAAMAGFKPTVKPAPAPPAPQSALLTLIPCNDWHVNLLTWERETGENWDLKIAEDTIGSNVEDAILRSPSSDTAIVLGGGDLMHADNDRNRTEKSGNVLDADGRHQKGIDVAQRLKVRTIDAALRRHKRVIVRVLRGNHDEYSSVAIAHFLLAWYRNEPRVTVDVDASLYFWFRFGHVFLGATHGHTVKLKDMASIMAHRRAEDWGLSRFRYIHGFHIHHYSKFATEGGGVISESHQAPIPQDAWHYGAGFLSGRSIQTITYHRDFGEVGRVRVAILDAASATPPKKRAS
jgi:hypothetical protein